MQTTTNKQCAPVSTRLSQLKHSLTVSLYTPFPSLSLISLLAPSLIFHISHARYLSINSSRERAKDSGERERERERERILRWKKDISPRSCFSSISIKKRALMQTHSFFLLPRPFLWFDRDKTGPFLCDVSYFPIQSIEQQRHVKMYSKYRAFVSRHEACDIESSLKIQCTQSAT